MNENFFITILERAMRLVPFSKSADPIAIPSYEATQTIPAWLGEM